MDFSRALGAELHGVREVEYEGQPARAVEGSRLYATDGHDLWQAVSDPERIARWFLPISGELQLGGRYRLEGNAEGTILRCDPPEALDVTWEFSGNVSWVSLRLTSEGEGTRLTLVHTMLKDEAAEAHWATYGPGATGVGWDLSFVGLGLFLDGGGQAFDREATDAWMISPDGKAFIRACAESWAQAHIASGEDPGVAQGMAKSTGDFYTGA